MGLESPTYISDLNPLWPVHTDGLNQADAHLREIKATLQTTFPNINGAVTASQSDLNTTTGMAATVALLGTNRVRNDIAQTLAGPLTVTGSVGASSLLQGGNVLIPTGVIVMWSGATTAVPAGWNLCDGTSGTPDLRGRFVVGAGATGGSYPTVGQTGGTNLQTITTSTVGNHTHTGATALGGTHSHTGTTDIQGSHSHGGNDQPHALTIAEMPTHDHGLGSQAIVGYAGGSYIPSGGSRGDVVFQSQGGGAAHYHAITADGSHAHAVTTSAAPDHTHSITGDGMHSHTVSIDVRPTYYALCLIMKL